MSSREIVVVALALAVPACGDVASPRSVACGAQPVEVLPNGGFEAATPAWMQDPPTVALICGTGRITPFEGARAACLGGTDGMTDTLSQQVPLPDGGKTVTLSGQICIDTAETQPVDHDTLELDLVDGATVVAPLGKYTNQQGTTPCQFMVFHQTGTLTSDPVMATLRIRSTLDTGMPTSFYLDALSLTISCQ
ncbi:MAG TPA: hypothetical protein VHW23_29935 [Kofleriaceae bacterium]|jgi:hypothetical protein|nr:hypothetical protein [Kofleriaceae bacterium]